MASVDQAKFLLDRLTREMNRIRDILAIVGLFYSSKFVLKIAWHLVDGLWTHVLSSVAPTDVNKYGKWAVVTGCTDGIGKAYCHQLAKRGMDIVLISRNMNKLQKMATELETCHRVRTHVVQADFSEGFSVYSKIATELQNRDVGILVNNVGVMYKYPMLFEEVSEDMAWKLITINVGAVTMMTRIVLPEMVQRGRGAIVNVSSSSAIYPLPMMAVYSATKIYVDYFTRAIQHEYRGSGIEIQCLMPFYVLTAMTKFSRTLNQLKPFVPDADKFARTALSTLGYSKRTTGHWSHGVQYLFCVSLPEWMWLRLGHLLHKLLRHDANVNKLRMLNNAPTDST